MQTPRKSSEKLRSFVERVLEQKACADPSPEISQPTLPQDRAKKHLLVNVFLVEESDRIPLGILSLDDQSLDSVSLEYLRNHMQSDIEGLPEKWSFFRVSENGLFFPISDRQEPRFVLSGISERQSDGCIALCIGPTRSSRASVCSTANKMRSSDWRTFLLDQRKSVLVIDANEIKESESIIGSGAMKVVHEGDWVGRRVAVVKFIDCTESTLPSIRRELAVYQCLRGHPNIVKLHGIVSDSKWVIEFCEWKLSGSSWATFNQRLAWALDICNGLISLHAFNLSHGDLKPDNVLIAKDKNGAMIAKLTDFGSALRIQASTISHRLTGGTTSFMAPELEHPEEKPDLAACDIYSLGRVILFMMSSTRGLRTDRDELTRIDEYFEKEKLLEFAEPIKGIVQRCCELDPKKRCSLQDVALSLKKLLDRVGVTVSQSSIMELLTSLLNRVVVLQDDSERQLEMLKVIQTIDYKKMTES